MGQMKFLLGAFLLLITDKNYFSVSASSDEIMFSNSLSDIDEQCESYCHKTIKPLFQNQLLSNDQGKILLDLHKKFKDFEQKIDRIIKNQENQEKQRHAENEIVEKSYKEMYEVNIPEELSESLGSGQGSGDESFVIIENSFKDPKDSEAELEQSKYKLLNNNAHNCLPFGSSSGIHTIQDAEIGSFEVRCDSSAAGNGWLVIQRRFNGKESFYRNWHDYKFGFGDLSGDFWLGLEKVYRLTNQQQYELLVNMVTYDGKTHFARYDDFRIGSGSEDYELKSIGKFTGTDTEKFEYNLHRKFTTIDRANDDWNGNCAEDRYSGWWHEFCTHVNPNGIYYPDAEDNKNSMHWFNDLSLKSIEMLIRPKNSIFS